MSYLEVLSRDLKVMDASAISLMRENGIPIVVFSIRQPGALLQGADGGGNVHTVIGPKVAERPTQERRALMSKPDLSPLQGADGQGRSPP